jgi:hypothetical protein
MRQPVQRAQRGLMPYPEIEGTNEPGGHNQQEESQEPNPHAQMQEEGAGETEGTSEPEPNVTPEEQAQYDQFVKNGIKVIYSDNALPKILDTLTTGNPIDSLANTAVMIVKRLVDSAKKNNAEIAGDIIYHGGIEILEDLANLSEKAGIHSYTQKELETSTYRAMDLYRDMMGNVDQSMYQQDLQQLKQLDETGQLDQIMPDAKQHFASDAAQQQPEAGQQNSAPGQRGMMQRGM